MVDLLVTKGIDVRGAALNVIILLYSNTISEMALSNENNASK